MSRGRAVHPMAVFVFNDRVKNMRVPIHPCIEKYQIKDASDFVISE